jgi:nucleoside-diphosphate-sugar epimerase
MEFDGITLVTGAAGFLGRHLAARLAETGVPLRAAVRAGEDARFLHALGAEVRCADLLDPETLPPLFAGGVDRVFHLAAICNLSTPYAVLHPTNVVGVERITRLAMESGVKRYVQMSSSSVYGPHRGRPFLEDSERAPRDDYGRSKSEGEEIVWKRIAEGLPAVVARPCTVYGPGCTDGAGKVFSRPTSLLAIPGSGRQRLSNVRVEDVAAAAVHLSEFDDAGGRAYNIADDSHPELGEALTLAAETFGSRAPRLHLPLGLVAAVATLQGQVARLRGRIPDLEVDAVRLLRDDYLVDNTKLKDTGYEFIYPDFRASMTEMGRLAAPGSLPPRQDG